MKTTGILILLAISVMGCNGQHKTNESFNSERISKTASFTVNETIDNVFPLYGAFEERKWAPGWEPVLIYPNKEVIEEGTAFKIEPHGHGHGDEGDLLWVISKFEPENYLIQYLVSTENRFWTITVKNDAIENDNKTKTTVTYTYTGLNKNGNQLNKKALEKMYESNLQDWADLINGYLEGKTIKSHH